MRKTRKIKINDICRQPAVLRLDDYVEAREGGFRKIEFRGSKSTNKADLCRSFEKLMEAIRRDKRHRVEAYANLKDSNEMMKRTVADLREGLTTCGKSIRSELQKIDNADTERLISIDPNSFYRHFQDGQKPSRT